MWAMIDFIHLDFINRMDSSVFVQVAKTHVMYAESETLGVPKSEALSRESFDFSQSGLS